MTYFDFCFFKCTTGQREVVHMVFFFHFITWFLLIPVFPSQVKTNAFLVLLVFTVQKD